MAINFNVAPCKKGFGVYVKAISGEALQALKFKFYGLPEGTARITTVSDRITRKATLSAANKVRDQLNSLPELAQIDIVKRLFIKQADRNITAAKVQYFRIERMYNGKFIPLFSSTNKNEVETLAYKYAGSNVPTKHKRTVARTQYFASKDFNKLTENSEVKAAVPKGLQGFTKELKDQTQEFTQRISQRRKTTTRLSFWNKR